MSDRDARRHAGAGAASGGLRPCPFCGGSVTGHVCGGVAAFGCGEWEYEAECGCGALFNQGPFDTPEEAEAEGAAAWNRRAS